MTHRLCTWMMMGFLGMAIAACEQAKPDFLSQEPGTTHETITADPFNIR